jgi:hypothetical protein
LTRSAAFLIRSTSRTEVPPNFCTMRAMIFYPKELARTGKDHCRSEGAYPYSFQRPRGKPGAGPAARRRMGGGDAARGDSGAWHQYR